MSGQGTSISETTNNIEFMSNDITKTLSTMQVAEILSDLTSLQVCVWSPFSSKSQPPQLTTSTRTPPQHSLWCLPIQALQRTTKIRLQMTETKAVTTLT